MQLSDNVAHTDVILLLRISARLILFGGKNMHVKDLKTEMLIKESVAKFTGESDAGARPPFSFSSAASAAALP